MVNHNKLKTNLKLVIQRLKLLGNKKSENARKYTKEIADYLMQNKIDRARIKVEHIIREDYMVEGMEIVEMYCDLLLARFGLIESMKELDPGLEESVASLLWVCPCIEAECPELKIACEVLQDKYGKEYAQACRTGQIKKVNERLMQKMNEQAPSRLLVEKYLTEIAASHRVPFKPDPELAVQDYKYFYSNLEKTTPSSSNDEKKGGGGNGGGAAAAMPTGDEILNRDAKVSHIGFNNPPPPRYNKEAAASNNEPIYPTIPDPPIDNPQRKQPPSNDQDDSFDDLEKRFQSLKKK